MGSNKNKQVAVNELKRKEWIRLSKKSAGKVHIEWSGDAAEPPTFNLTYIDDDLAPAAINHRVVGYHVGHDHGKGWRHRHYYANTDTLDDTHDWAKCAPLFVADCSAELSNNGKEVPTALTVATLVEVMN